MTFDEFVEHIQQNILFGWKEDASAEVQKAKKNNGIVYTGIYIREGQESIVPAIYLESYFERYRTGETMEDLISDLRAQYEWATSHSISFDYDIENYEHVRDKLIYRLVNYDRNQEMLSRCPHIRLEDLAVTFRWLAYQDSAGISTALITNQELELWNVTLEDILLDATRNTQRLFPARTLLMDDFLAGSRIRLTGEAVVPMYILTNEQQVNGATVILYDNLLENFSREHPGSYYILPSSIHELILVSAEWVEHPENLPDMVREANRIVVDRDEVLSDSVYYYDSAQNSISKFCPE